MNANAQPIFHFSETKKLLYKKLHVVKDFYASVRDSLFWKTL